MTTMIPEMTALKDRLKTTWMAGDKETYGLPFFARVASFSRLLRL